MEDDQTLIIETSNRKEDGDLVVNKDDEESVNEEQLLRRDTNDSCLISNARKNDRILPLNRTYLRKNERKSVSR